MPIALGWTFPTFTAEFDGEALVAVAVVVAVMAVVSEGSAWPKPSQKSRLSSSSDAVTFRAGGGETMVDDDIDDDGGGGSGDHEEGEDAEGNGREAVAPPPRPSTSLLNVSAAPLVPDWMFCPS